MLASARSSGARTLSLSRPAWSLALPAESSRQAAVRASLHAGSSSRSARLVRPVHGGTKAPYSAAAVAVAESEADTQVDHRHISDQGPVQGYEQDRRGGAWRRAEEGEDVEGYGEWSRRQESDVAGPGRFSMPSDGHDGLPDRVRTGSGIWDKGEARSADELNDRVADIRPAALDPYLITESDAPPRPDRPTPRPLPSSIDDLPPLIQFRYTLSGHARRALIVLGDMSTADLKRLTLLEFDTFLHALSKTFGSSGSVQADIPDEELRSLVRLHAALREYRTPDVPAGERSGDTSTAVYTRDGEALHGKRLVRMMRACMFLGAHGVWKSIWKGRLADIRSGSVTDGGEAVADSAINGTGSQDKKAQHNAFPGAKAVTQVAEDIIKARAWPLAHWLFQPSQMQLDWYTPAVFEAAVRTFQVFGEPSSIVRLFGEMESRGVRATADAYCGLMQAHLELGEIDLARTAMKRGEADRGLTGERLQIGILRGYMVLGGTAAVADKVMKDIAALEITPSAGLLNSLIRVRLRERDSAGALKLLANFDFAGGSTEATSDTYALTLRLHAQSNNLVNLRDVWHRLVSADIPLTAQHLQVVTTAMGQAGPDAADEALKAIKAHVDRTPFTAWRIPRDLELSTGVFNALLHGMGKHHGVAGAERALRLMRRAQVSADDATAQVLVQFVTDLSSSPTEGLTLIKQLQDRLPQVRATSDTLDTALGAALSIYRTSINPSISATPASADPQAGISTSGPFRRAISPVLQSLQARQARSTSKTLAHRLYYEALVQSTATQSGVPDVRHAWDQILARGYEPTAEHILALVKGYAQSGAMRQAEETLKLAQEEGIPRTVGMWMEMLNGWADKGHLGRAEDAYKAICSSGPDNRGRTPRGRAGDISLTHLPSEDQPDIVAMSAMIRAYYRCGSYDRARRLATELAERFSHLDGPALCVVVHALRLDNRPLAALHLVRERTTKLSTQLRRLVQQIRKYAYTVASKNAHSAAQPSKAKAKASAPAATGAFELGSSYDFTASAAERAKVFHLATEILKRDDEARPPHTRRQISAKTVRSRLVRAATDDGKRKRRPGKGKSSATDEASEAQQDAGGPGDEQ